MAGRRVSGSQPRPQLLPRRPRPERYQPREGGSHFQPCASLARACSSPSLSRMASIFRCRNTKALEKPGDYTSIRGVDNAIPTRSGVTSTHLHDGHRPTR